MILTSLAVALARRPLGESDRMTVLYTRDLGKLTVRFMSVLKPQGKLKALSEPLVWGDYRLYLKPSAEFGRCVGGGLISVFPGIRSDLGRLKQALSFLELMNRITPDRQPSSAKYELLTETLQSLEGGLSPWTAAAYALRLFELAGFGMDRTGWPRDEWPLWEALHRAKLSELALLPGAGRTLGRIQRDVRRHMGLFLDQPLNTEAFLSGSS